MSWLTIALIASFLFGTTNFIDRFLVEKRIPDPFFVSIMGGIVAPIAGILLIMVRGFPTIGLGGAIILLLGGIAAEIALVPWYMAIKRDDTSRVVPYLQLIPVVVLVLSYILLGEELSRSQLIGFVLITAGGLSLAIERPSKDVFKIRKSFWYVIASIMLWGPVSVLFKFAAVDQNFWDALIYEMIGMGIGACLLWIYARTDMRTELKKLSIETWGVVGLNEVAYLAARVLLFYAVIIGPAALVSVTGGIQPLFALIIGLVMSKWFPTIIKEDVRMKIVVYKLVAIAIIFIGVAFINR
jgi:drug/metabolite transporter (DMT)-like permease